MPVALISGGAGTIGAAIARRLAQDDWSVIIGDVDLKAAKSIALSIGSRATAAAMDVTRLEDVSVVMDDVVANLGTLDCAIFASGGRFGAEIGEFAKAPTESWRPIVDLHLKGVLNLYYSALKHMRLQRHGCLVSISAVEAYRGLPGSAAYSAAKAGVAVLTETLVRECQPDNIRVNSVIPPVPNAMIGSDWTCAVSEAVAFLVSDKASLTTGAALDVSNGWALH